MPFALPVPVYVWFVVTAVLLLVVVVLWVVLLELTPTGGMTGCVWLPPLFVAFPCATLGSLTIVPFTKTVPFAAVEVGETKMALLVLDGFAVLKTPPRVTVPLPAELACGEAATA